MWNRFRRTRTRTGALVVSVCERCAKVCDARCRRAALRERALLHQLWLGMRV